MLQYSPYHIVHPPKAPPKIIDESKKAKPEKPDVASDLTAWKPRQFTFTVSPLHLIYLSLFLSFLNLFLILRLSSNLY